MSVIRLSRSGAKSESGTGMMSIPIASVVVLQTLMFPEKVVAYDKQAYDVRIVRFESPRALQPVTKRAVKPFIQVVLIKQALQVYLAHASKTRAKISVEYLSGRLDKIRRPVADQYARQAKCSTLPLQTVRPT